MSVTFNSSKQCLIWFGRPNSLERSTLAAAGWQIRTVSTQQPTDIGMRGEDTLVGVIDLRERAEDDLESIERLLWQHRHMALLAITPAASVNTQPPVQRLLGNCLQHFANPVDLSAMILRLQQLGGDALTETSHGLDSLLGESPPMLGMRAAIRKFAPVDLPVLITGETGTGKEVAANALHRLSARAQRPFNAINCGAIPSTLVQSELFGHERGAFTGASTRRMGLFETAHTGTVFLDEIGDLPLDVQTNLLRVLQEGKIERVGSNQSVPVDVRILAATHVNLEDAVEQGKFRRDLYYRLNVLRLPMPPLRDRGNDIPLLARHFLHTFRSHHSTRARGFSGDASAAMERFSWPGNVRELMNRVQRAAITTEAELISCADLELAPVHHGDNRLLNGARTQAERDTLIACLQLSRYNISDCARRMQVSRVTIYRLCRKHQVMLEVLR